VVREHQVRLVRDEDGAGIAPRAQALELVAQAPGVDDHAPTEHRGGPVVERAAREVVELEHLAPDDDRVTGVGAAGVAHDDVGLRGQRVDDLAFPLVAPLGADDGDAGHADLLRARTPLGRAWCAPADDDAAAFCRPRGSIAWPR